MTEKTPPADIKPEFRSMRNDFREETFRTIFDRASDGFLIASEQTKRLLYGNDTICSMLGYTLEELETLTLFDIHPPKDHPLVLATFEKQAKREKVLAEDLPVLRKDGSIFYADISAAPAVIGGEHCILGIFRDITQRKQAAEERQAHIHFLESLERIDLAIKWETDVEQILRHLLETVFSIFDCDRAWLFYPCDPDAPSFRVPMEIHRPEFPGAMVLNADVPISSDMAQNLRTVLESDDPVISIAGTEAPINRVSSDLFNVQSQMFVALHPKVGKPWVFGIHQCSYPRVWTNDEKKLFKEISRRVADGLSSVLLFRELQDNEERFRVTFEQAAVGVAHVAQDGRWLRVNQKLCEIVGYSREDLLQKTFQDITYPEDLDADIENIRKVLAGELPTYSMEKRYIRKDGSIVWINLTVSFVHPASGEQGYFISVIEDISERKRAEQALYEAQQVYRALIENSPDIIARYDPDGRRTYVNPTYLKVAQIPRQELLATAPKERSPLPSPSAAALQDLLSRVLASGVAEALDVVWTKADHVDYWYNVFAFPEFDREGKVVSVMTISRDITERKQTEEELHRLNRELRAISSCNQALMRIEDEQTLLNNLCRIVCDEAGYRMAWVGYAEHDDAKTVRPVAWGGVNDGYLAEACITWADTLRGRGPAGTSIRTGETSCFQDFATDARAVPWREKALQRGYRSCIGLPLKDEQANSFGALMIYSTEPNAFTPDEVRLLEELAGDLSFGITVLRARTKHKQAEEALRKSEKDLNEAQRLTKIGSWEWDATTDTITWSAEYYNIYGFDPTQRPPGYEEHLKAYTPESAARLDAAVKKNMQTGEAYELDLELAGTKGVCRWITARSETMRDAQGKIIGLRGTAQDITERKQAEIEQARLATVIGQIAETIVITDLTGTILYANPAFEKTTGYSCQEALGQNPRILQSGRHDVAFYKEMWGILTSGKVWHGHFINKRKDGTLYEEDAVISPIRDSTGTIVNFVAIKRDVTREVQLEQQVQQAQKMDAIGRLAGGVSHDFNNILQAILGFCEITLADMCPQDAHRQNLIEIEKSAHRAANLTRQLLVFSRQQMIVPAVLDLNALIVNTQKMLNRLIGEDIHLILCLTPNIKYIKADAGQIEQVIMNLVVNARDAMSEGGQLTISTTSVTFTEENAFLTPEGQPGDFVCLTVTDSGTGMPKETLAHIFEPFFTTKGPSKGTGLGLAVIHGIVKQHNGWIHVTSQVGQGSTFAVYLPAYVSPEQASSGAHDERLPFARGNGERILVVEDATEVRNLTARVLQKADYEVAVAKDAHHAHQLVENAQHPFDLVISDVVLPDQNGIDLVEQLLVKTPRLAVLLCSGYTDERTRWKTVEKKGFHFMQKPYSFSALLCLVRQILDDRLTAK